MSFTHTTFKAHYKFIEDYQCQICKKTDSGLGNSFSFTPWYDHIAIHFAQAYSQIIDNFASRASGNKYNFPLIPASSYPFVFYISIPLKNGRPFTYAKSADFQSITSSQTFKALFESIARNLYFKAIDLGLLSRPTEGSINIFYTVEFLYYEPLKPNTDNIPVHSDIPYSDLLYFKDTAGNSFISLFLERIINGLRSFLGYLSLTSYLTTLDEGRPLYLTLDDFSQANALEVLYSKKNSSIKIIPSSLVSSISGEKVNLGPLLYDGSDFLHSNISEKEKDNFLVLYSLFYYLLSMASQFRNISITDLYQTQPSYETIQHDVFLSRDASFFPIDKTINNFSFTPQLYCKVCNESDSPYSNFDDFFRHISVHFFDSYGKVLTSGKQVVPILNDSDHAFPFVFRFTPLDYNFESSDYPVFFSYVFKGLLLEKYFENDTRHRVSLIDHRKKLSRSSYNYSIFLYNFNDFDFKGSFVPIKLKESLSYSASTSKDHPIFTYHDLEILLSSNNERFIHAFKKILIFLNEYIDSNHGASDHYTRSPLESISRQGHVIFDFRKSSNYSLDVYFTNKNFSITIIHTNETSDDPRIVIEDFLTDFLLIHGVNEDFFQLLTLYFCIHLIKDPPPSLGLVKGADTPQADIAAADDFEDEIIEDYINEDENTSAVTVPKSKRVSKSAFLKDFDLSSIPENDRFVSDSQNTNGIRSSQEFSELGQNHIQDHLKNAKFVNREVKLERLSFMFKLYDPFTKFDHGSKEDPIVPPPTQSFNKIAINQIYSLLQQHNILTPRDPPPTILGKNIPSKNLILRFLTEHIVHRFFSSSYLHRLICHDTHYKDGITATSVSYSNFDDYNDSLSAYINFPYLRLKTTKKMKRDNTSKNEAKKIHLVNKKRIQLYKAVFFYFSIVFYKNQLNEFFYYKTVNPDNKVLFPTPNYALYCQERRERNEQPEIFIPGKFFYRAEVGKRIFHKELKKISKVPNPKASDSARLTKNKKLYEVRAILNDNRDLLSTILQDLYTTDKFLTIIPTIVNRGAPVKKSFNLQKITLLLFIYYIEKTLPDDAHRAYLITNICDLIKSEGYPSQSIRAKNKTLFKVDSSPTSSFNAFFSAGFFSSLGHVHMVISDTIQKIDTNSLNDDSIVLLIQHIGSVISTIDTLINSNNYLLGDSGLTHQLRTALSDILDFIRSNRQQIVNNQLIQNKLKSVITINNVILSDAIIRFKSFTIPSNPPIQVPDSPVDNTPFDINQISFDTLLDSYLSSSSFYFEYRDQGKDVFADILTRVIRSDISKRLVTYFIIHEFFRQESPQDQGPLTYLLQILRNKQVPVKLTSSIIEKLSSTLHHYISDEFLLDITLDQNLFKNQVKDEFSDIIPIALGLLRNRSDSAFLTDPSIKNFFSTIRVRKASRTKDKILTFYPLGTSRSRQRIRIRSFLHLTSEEYFALPNLESKFNQFYQLQKLITLNLPNLISNSNPVDLTQDPDINANSHSKDPDTVLFIHDLNHPDITYVNAEKYLSEVNSVRTYDAEAKRPTLHKEASSLSYNNFIHIILLNVVDILKSLSILQIGTIPVIRRGILDLSNKGRDTDSPYTFTLPSTTVYPKNVDDIYYKYIFNNIPDTSPQFETIQLKLKLFNDSSISYTLNFKNWLNRKIDKLSKQIDKLQQTNNLAIINNFEMTPVSPNVAEQKSFILAQKQRNLEYYKAQNKALINFIIRNKRGTENFMKYYPWSYDVHFPDKTELQDIFRANSMTPGDMSSFNTRSLSSLLTTLTTIYKYEIHKHNENFTNKFTPNQLQYFDQKVAEFHGLDPKTFIENYFDNSKKPNKKLVNLGLNTYLVDKIKTIFENAFNHPELLDSDIHLPPLITDISDPIFNTYCDSVISQAFLRILAKEISNPKTKIQNDPIDNQFISKLLDEFSDAYKKILISFFINHLVPADKSKIVSNPYELSYLTLYNVFRADSSSFSLYHTTDITLLADQLLGSSKVFVKIAFPVPPINPIPFRIRNDNEYRSIMGIDLGLRSIATVAIRSIGEGCDSTPDPDPLAVVSSSIFRFIDQGLSSAATHSSITRSLNRQSRFLQRARNNYYTQSVTTKGPIFDFSFTSSDHRFFHTFKLSRNISSVQRKKTSVNRYVTHKASTDILQLGIAYDVSKFVFEDLSSLQKYFQTFGGHGQVASYFSSNLFGQVIKNIQYKSLRFGFNNHPRYIDIVDPDFTSQMCPFSVAKSNNRFLSIADRQNHVRDYCRTGNSSPTNSFIVNNKGELFLHYPMLDPHEPQRPILFNRDFVGAFNLTYCGSH